MGHPVVTTAGKVTQMPGPWAQNTQPVAVHQQTGAHRGRRARHRNSRPLLRGRIAHGHPGVTALVTITPAALVSLTCHAARMQDKKRWAARCCPDRRMGQWQWVRWQKMHCDWLKCRDLRGHYCYQRKHCKTADTGSSGHTARPPPRAPPSRPGALSRGQDKRA